MLSVPLLDFPDEDDYRKHFENVYCKGPIVTADGIKVRFKKSDFDHCCFESNRRTRQKAYFSEKRAKRLDWIKDVLQDANADLRIGWDNSRKRYDPNRRVAILSSDHYVVVISVQRKNLTGRFITAFVADSGRTFELIQKSPKWEVIQA